MKIERPRSNQPIPENAKKVFAGKIFDVYQWEQKLYDGTTATFEKIKRPDTVVVFPVLEDGTILVTYQEQPGRDPFMSAPGGRIDEGEDVLEAAKRELLEETGYDAKEYILWKSENSSSKIDYAVYFFIAKGCTKSKEQELEAGEKITVKAITLDELIQQSKNENFRDKEVSNDLLEAYYNTEKKEELKKLFGII